MNDPDALELVRRLRECHRAWQNVGYPEGAGILFRDAADCIARLTPPAEARREVARELPSASNMQFNLSTTALPAFPAPDDTPPPTLDVRLDALADHLHGLDSGSGEARLLREAASELRSSREEIARLREALEPFASAAGFLRDDVADACNAWAQQVIFKPGYNGAICNASDLRRAAKALEG